MNKLKKFFSGRLFYSLAVGALVVAVAATGAMILNDNKSGDGESQYLPLDESASQVVIEGTNGLPSVGATIPATEEETRAVAAIPETTVPETTEAATEPVTEPETPAETEPVDVPIDPVDDLSFSEENALQWPIQGEIIRDFSMDTTVFYATLQAYKVSPSILIQGAPDMEVKAAADAIVGEIGNNEEIGNYMVLKLGSGYELTYGQLKDIQVATGDMVHAGDLVARLDEPTIYYSVEGCNLYFQMNKDGVPVDPLDYVE